MKVETTLPFETTLRKALLLRMGMKASGGQTEFKRQWKEIRGKIEEQCADIFEEAEVRLLPVGGFNIGRAEYSLEPVELKLLVGDMNALQAAVASAIWPGNLPDVLDDEIIELTDEVTAWIEADKSNRHLRNLSKKAREQLLKESLKEKGDEEK